MSQTIKELLGDFSRLSAAALSFLETDYGCRRAEGFSQFDGYPGLSSLRTSNFSNVPGIFSYVVRYSDKEAVLDISYGDRELLVEPLIIYPTHKLRFYPSELLSAAGITREAGTLSGGAWVQTREHMQSIVDQFAAALRPHWTVLRELKPQVLDRALIQRGRKMRFAQDEQRRKDSESACIQASTAFHSGDFRKAVALLTPFIGDADLPKTSQMLYELAAKQK